MFILRWVWWNMLTFLRFGDDLSRLGQDYLNVLASQGLHVCEQSIPILIKDGTEDKVVLFVHNRCDELLEFNLINDADYFFDHTDLHELKVELIT